MKARDSLCTISPTADVPENVKLLAVFKADRFNFLKLIVLKS